MCKNKDFSSFAYDFFYISIQNVDVFFLLIT